MDIFFLRHGETEYNRKGLHQPASAPLNEKGRAQAAHAIPRISELGITHIVSSDMARAKETADIVAAKLGHTVDTSSALVELLRPSYLINKKHISLPSLQFIWRWQQETHDDKLITAGGESRAEFLGRIKATAALLATYPKDARVLVVSHSAFINFFIRHMCDETSLSFIEVLLLLMKVKRLDNSSLTHVTFNKEAAQNTCAWQLVTFDDDQHVIK